MDLLKKLKSFWTNLNLFIKLAILLTVLGTIIVITNINGYSIAILIIIISSFGILGGIKNKKVAQTVISFIFLISVTGDLMNDIQRDKYNKQQIAQETNQSKFTKNLEDKNESRTTDALEIKKTEANEEKNSIDYIINDLREQVGEGEKITDVTLKEQTLVVNVDFSHVDPTPLTMEDLIDSRVSSISDSILKHSELNDKWNDIKIDFGIYGYVLLDKTLVKDDGLSRYFKHPDGKIRFELQK